MKFLAISIFLLTVSFSSFAQLNCGKIIPESEVAFKGGESLKYTVTYSSAMVQTSIADVTFRVEPIIWGSVSSYKVTADARTRSFYNVFFKLENRYESILERSRLRPMLYSANQREGSYRYVTSYAYNWNTKTAKTTGHNIKRNRTYEKTQHLTQCSYDAMSLFYNMRCMDDSQVGPGYKLKLDLLLEDTIRTISFRYVAHQEYTVKGVGTFKTLKFVGDLATSTGESFEDGSKFYILISDDRNHIPIFMESPIKIGRIQGTLNSWQNLKFPLESLIKHEKKI